MDKLKDKVWEAAWQAIYDVVKKALEDEIHAGRIRPRFDYEEVYDSFVNELYGCWDDLLMTNAVGEAVAEVWHES